MRRQFLEQMSKPDVDSIDGLSPAIAIEQKSVNKNPRSTVGTATEIADYLRLFFARVGQPHCTSCGKTIRHQTLQQMAESARYCFADFAEIDTKAAKKYLRPVILEPLKEATAAFAALDVWSAEHVTRVIEEISSRHQINMGKLGQPIRVAVTGGPVSPPIDITLSLVGQQRAVARLEAAIGFIEARVATSH